MIFKSQCYYCYCYWRRVFRSIIAPVIKPNKSIPRQVNQRNKSKPSTCVFTFYTNGSCPGAFITFQIKPNLTWLTISPLIYAVLIFQGCLVLQLLQSNLFLKLWILTLACVCDSKKIIFDFDCKYFSPALLEKLSSITTLHMLNITQDDGFLNARCYFPKNVQNTSTHLGLSHSSLLGVGTLKYH